MALGGSFGIGAPGDVQEFILVGLSPAAAGGGVTALNSDTTTALAFAMRALPAGSGMNERLRDYLNTQYGTSSTDIQANLARFLKDIKS
jgi:hypothetical protein